MDHRVDFVIEQMERDMGRRFAAHAMASMVNLSASHLAHLFRKEAKASPQHYAKLIRMRRAKQLLETSFLSVKQVMTDTGFNDASHFVRDFKRLYGKTPGQHRKDSRATLLSRDHEFRQETAEMAN